MSQCAASAWGGRSLIHWGSCSVLPTFDAPPGEPELVEEVDVGLRVVVPLRRAGRPRRRSPRRGTPARRHRSRRTRRGGCRASGRPRRCSRPGTPRCTPCRARRRTARRSRRSLHILRGNRLSASGLSMPFVLQPEWVGRRVERASGRRTRRRRSAAAGRRRRPTSSAWTPRPAVVDTRTGLVEVPVALVTAARDVPPSTAEELQLQDIAAHGWPAAHTEQLDGWLLRADPGGTRRANSVLPARQLRPAVRRRVAPRPRVLRRTRSAGAVPAPDGGAAPARCRAGRTRLAGRGADRRARRRADTGTAATCSGGADVTIADAPDDAWLAMPINVGRRRPPGPRCSPGTRTPRSRRVRVDGVLAADRAGDRRRRLARRDLRRGRPPTSDVRAWPARSSPLCRRGASRAAPPAAYVQVAAANDAGQQLFAALGYRHHHDYHYLREPDPS